MDPSCAEHVLTEAERVQFERDGYLVLRAALTTDRVQELNGVALAEDDAFRREDGVGPYHVMNRHDLIDRDPAYLELIDLPTTFPKVWGILGWNIQLFHTQLLVTPTAPEGAIPGAYAWHQDNNRMNLDLETNPQPRVSVKTGYFLSPLPEPGMGNLCVVPGSHRRGRPTIPVGQQPDGALEITAEAGDAILFDRRIWHSASTNLSHTPRIFLTYGYSYRWLRPKSRMEHPALMNAVDPIRRQLLGWSTDPNSYFDPTDEDVPLREWICSHLGEAALAP